MAGLGVDVCSLRTAVFGAVKPVKASLPVI
jgi:hypothetical protein